MASKPNIRFTLFEIRPNTLLKHVNNEARATGVIGTLLQDLWERTLYKRFNYSLNWVSDGGGAGKKTNGAYNGLLGMLQRNETDSCPLPYGIFAFDETVKYSTPTNALVGRILNSPHPKTFSVDLMNCYQGFANDVWLSVFLLIVVTSFVALKIKRMTMLDAVYYTLAILLNKNFLCIKTLLFQLCIVGFVLLCIAFTQSMNADLLKKDYTPIIDSIEDLRRQPEVRPVFIDDGAIVSLFEHGASPVYAQLWERAKKVGNRDLYVFRMDPTEYSRATKTEGRLAMISTEPIIKIAASFGCQKNPKRRSWIAQKPLQETLLGLYMNANLTAESVGIMNEIASLYMEGGHYIYAWKYAGENVVKDLLVGSSEPLCIKKNVEELFVETENKYSVRLSNIIYFILVIVSGLALGLVLFSAEYFFKK